MWWQNLTAGEGGANPRIKSQLVEDYRSSTNFCVYFIFASRLVVVKIRSQNVVARCSHANEVLAQSQNHNIQVSKLQNHKIFTHAKICSTMVALEMV